MASCFDDVDLTLEKVVQHLGDQVESGELVPGPLHYPAEIRPAADVVIEDTDVKESEIALAMQLVQQGASKSFRPGEYHDEVRERVEALISKKVEGEDIRTVATEEPKKQVIDLMSALKASLGGQAPTGGASESAGGRGTSAARSLAPQPSASPRAPAEIDIDAAHQLVPSASEPARPKPHAESVPEPEPVPTPQPPPVDEPDEDDVLDAFDASEVPGIDDLD